MMIRELLHLQKELMKRKAKMVELAFKKRDYESGGELTMMPFGAGRW